MSLAENLPCVQSSFSSIAEGFYKPVSYNAIEQLLWQYKAGLKQIKKLNAFISSDNMQSAISYHLRAGDDKRSNRGLNSIFGSADEAIKVLDSDYWERALNITDVYEHMPQKRRTEWRESIDSRDVPPFTEESVIATLRDLLLARDSFLAERVDGCFRALSGEHVTNAPEGFGKRMIMYIADNYNGWVSVNSSRAGYLHDLRVIIAKFMCRTAPMHGSTYDIVKAIYDNKKTGEWQEIDGGAFRLRCYLKGTCHCEVHPDLAWRLNEILAFLYPKAIPPKFRKRTEKKLKAFSFTQSLIPGDVLYLLQNIENDYLVQGEGHDRRVVGRDKNVFYISGTYGKDKHLIAKAYDILEACGGEHLKGDRFRFDYDFKSVLQHILAVGAIPDHVAHQYYPTPKPLAEKLVSWCDIQKGSRCLEPSAGQGAIAQFMPESTICVEASSLYCKILKQKGYKVVNDDFVKWSKGIELFSRICMNPPFSQGRALAHLTAASNLLKKGGILTAVIPTSIKNSKPIEGFEYEWEDVDQSEFPGVSIDLSMVKMIRKEYV